MNLNLVTVNDKLNHLTRFVSLGAVEVICGRSLDVREGNPDAPTCKRCEAKAEKLAKDARRDAYYAARDAELDALTWGNSSEVAANVFETSRTEFEKILTPVINKPERVTLSTITGTTRQSRQPKRTTRAQRRGNKG